MIPVGPPVIGDDFLDREQERSIIHGALAKSSVLLVAPRRYGKTSLMHAIEAELVQQDWTCVFLDVEDVETPEDLLTEMLLGLIDNSVLNKRERIKTAFKGWLRGTSLESISVKDLKLAIETNVSESLHKAWRQQSREVASLLGGNGDKLLIILDELPIALQNMAPTDRKRFLQWFRKLRQEHTDVRFLVGGSVSIDRVVREVDGMPLLNDLHRVRVGGFSREAAASLVHRASEQESWGLDGETVDAILEQVGQPYIPYLLGAFLDTFHNQIVVHRDSPTPELVRDVYDRRLMGSMGKHHFEHYRQRLRIHYTDQDRRAAESMLALACRKESVRRDALFAEYRAAAGEDEDEFEDLMADLENDFYLETTEDGRVRFQTQMLRDWWQRYHASA